MANKVYTNSEQPITFIDPTIASGSGYVSFSPAAMANGNGQMSDPRDLGAPPRSTLFRWRAKAACNGSPSLNTSVEIYWAGFDNPAEASGDSSLTFGPDGNLGSGNQSVTDANRLRNLQWLGAITIDRATTATTFTNSGLCNLYGRYGSVIFWNNTGVALSSTQSATAFSLTPVPDEIE